MTDLPLGALLPAVLIAVLLAAGCQSGGSTRIGQLFPGTGRPEIEELIEYGNRLRGLSGAELKREYATLTAGVDEATASSQTLKLALLLSVPGTPLHDDARAVQLLNEWSADKPGSPGQLVEFARLYAALIGERQRQLEQSRKELRVTQLRLESSQAQASALERKLEALQQLEQELQQRVVE